MISSIPTSQPSRLSTIDDLDLARCVDDCVLLAEAQLDTEPLGIHPSTHKYLVTAFRKLIADYRDNVRARVSR